MIPISAVLPGAGSRAASTGAPVIPGAHSKGSIRDLFATGQAQANFASLYGQQAAALATAAHASSASSPANADLLGQIAALLKKGTPLPTIVDRIAKSIASATAQQLQGAYSQSELDRLRNSLAQSIANALSPPGNGPPGTAAEQAATLAARLRQLVESLARETQNGTGQQNELSGTILDAFSAKDIPAQQKTTAPASTLDIALVVRSLLSAAMTTLNPSSGSPAQVAAAPPIPVPTPPSVSNTTAPPSGNAAVSSGSMSMSNAPDLLARMLVRAAGADAAVNGPATASAANASTQAAPAPSPSMLAARFAALLGESASAIASGSASDASQNDASNAGNPGQTFDTPVAPAPATDANASASLAASTPTMLSHVQDALANASPATAPRVDISAVIEQMVKGMVMRTDQQGTSQIRLALQPDNLGPVTMKLTVTGTQVSASVVAQNVDVRNVLVANHQELARSLADAGLTLSGFSVDVSGGDAGKDQSKDRTTGFGRRFTVHELNANAATSEAADVSTQGPSLLPGNSLDLFNSLA
jgi:flagellar hook-length control protein FliK